MIIYGSKASTLATENLGIACPNCGTQNSLHLTVFQKYAHIYWIPLFPIGKTGATYCDNCKQVLEKDLFPQNILEKYQNTKADVKAPLWHFSGVAIVAVLIAWGTVYYSQREKKNAELLLNPQAGDIYQIELNPQSYTLFKVEMVVGDTIWMVRNEFETNKSRGLSSIQAKGDEAYLDEAFGMLKGDLKGMLDKGEILKIDRK